MLMKVINNYDFKGQTIELKTGDTIKLGEKSDVNGSYPNWTHCTSERTGKNGWVADRIITVENGIASVNEDYTSEEMSVLAGDLVDTVYELNGWYWCKRLSDSKEAWVDKNNLKPAN